MADHRPPLAQLIAHGRGGQISQSEFARAFAETRMILLLASAPDDGVAHDGAPAGTASADGETAVTADDAAIEPLILELPSGEPAVAVFGGPDLVPDDYIAAAPNPLALVGRELLEMLPEGVGLALNPGSEDSLQLRPEEIPTFAFVALGK